MISTNLQYRKPRIAALIVAMLACFSAPFGYAQSTIVINGVEGELANNIRLLVSQPPEKEELRKFNRYIDGLPKQVVTALSAYGYYAAQAKVSVNEVAAPKPKNAAGKAVEKIGDTITGNDKQSDKNSSKALEGAGSSGTITQVTIDVVRNAPVRIRKLELLISGLEKEDNGPENPDNDLDADDVYFDTVLAQIRQKLNIGQIFISGDYDSAKSSLLTTAQELGYFDFEFSQAQVRVSRKASTADITIVADAGKRFTFGEILFKQRTFSKTFMNRWVPFEPGDPFKAALIGELTQNLQSSGYFSSVRVRPLIDPRYEQTVPITVDLTQREENQVAVGIGYSTNTQLRTKLSWDKPLLNSNGHSAEFGVSLSRYEQSASASYRIPRKNQPLYNFWGIEYGLLNEDLGDVQSYLSTLNFQRVTRTKNDWLESLFIRWERERTKEDIGTEDTSNADEKRSTEEETDLVLPGVSYSRNRSKGDPFPTWGQTLSFQIMGGSKYALSTIDFLKTIGRFRYLRAVTERNTLIFTTQYGAIYTNDKKRIPGTQRFFAGGDRTVRGFAYNDISPRNEKGKAVGGRYLEVLNLEYNYRFRDKWSGALFTDAGRAFDHYSETDYSVGAGFGLRWQSPVGPFRIDIATPVRGEETGGVRVHLSLGPDF